MAYAIAGIDPAPFRHLFGRSDAELAAAGAIRMTADAKSGFPCRVTLEDAEPGEELLLLNYEHLPVETPYRSRHATSFAMARRRRRTSWTRCPSNSAAACCRYGHSTAPA